MDLTNLNSEGNIKHIIYLIIKLLVLFAAFYLYFLFANKAAPSGIFLFPLFLAAIPLAIDSIFLKMSLYTKGLISILLVFISDLLLRNYAGGTHDSEGNGLIVVFFIGGAGIFILTEIVLLAIKSIEGESKLRMLIVIPVQIILIIAYLNYFGWYGMDVRIYTDSIQESKKEGLFLNDYKIVNNTLINNNDTVIFHEAWLDKGMRVDHKQLIKKKYQADFFELNILLKRSSNIKHYPVAIVDRRMNLLDDVYSNNLRIKYNNSILKRDSIVLNINYESIDDSIILIKR